MKKRKENYMHISVLVSMPVYLKYFGNVNVYMIYDFGLMGTLTTLTYRMGWSGGAMVLGKLPVPGRPTNSDKSRARAYCACSWCGWELF